MREILCPEYRTGKKVPWKNWEVAVYPKKEEVQQSGMQSETLKGVAKKRDEQREVRRMLKPLREIWLNIGLEKIDMHEGVAVKALLDSGATRLFISKQLAAREEFKLDKLEKLLKVRNVNGSNNSEEAITHETEANVYYKGHVERVKMNVCKLGAIDIILGMPWLQVHNLKINWETGEVKMTRCLSICGRNSKIREKKETKKGKRVVTLEEEKIVRWAIDDKKDWGKEKKVEADHKKIEKIVPQKFLKWKKVFGKVELERMLTRKIWDHTIDLKEMFKPKKRRIYPLSKNEREEVQNFVNDQLRKGYIRPSKSPQMSPVFFVGKKDRSKRMVIDYHSLNN